MGTSDLQFDAMDPMDRLVARGISVRALVALAPYGADWLAQHQDDRFRMCYFDETGKVVNEDVTAVGLVLRAQQLGWTAFEDLEPGAAPWIFCDAKMYPVGYLHAFRLHFNEVWLPNKAHQYFRERDPAALPFLDKILLEAPGVPKLPAA